MLETEGVAGGDKIALLLRNGREIIELILGAQKIGVVACPLNTWAKPKELEATLGQADPKLLVYDTAHTEQVEKVARNDVPLLAVGDPEKAADDSGDYEDLLMRQPTSAPSPFTRNRGTPLVIIH